MSDPHHPATPENPTPNPAPQAARPAQAPPPGYPYPPAPAAPKRSIFGTLFKIFGGVVVITGALIVGMIAGYYAALFAFLGGDMVAAQKYRDGEGERRIAILAVEGTIMDTTVDFVRRSVDRILKDDTIGAVVLRVESPGGSAAASDQILQQLDRLKRSGMPIVASYGAYAASGGYYVSCQANTILAEPTTLTGSIGVIAQVPTLNDLLEEKLGIKMEVITASGSPQKDVANNIYRDWTEADRAALRKIVDAIHQQFVKVVDKGRADLTTEQVRQLASGEVFMAEEALANGLIDEIGYLDTALERAVSLGAFKHKDPPVILFKPRAGAFAALGVSVEPNPASAAALIGQFDPATARRWLEELSVPRILFLYQR